MKFEMHCFIKNSKCVCVYCSWTQASKIHCTSIADLIKTVIHCTSTAIWSKRCALFNAIFAFSSTFFFSLNYRGKMPSKLFNAPSKTTSMNCTYPPTTKPSKQSTHDTSKPITRNSLKRSPLFFISSSSPSLRLGHRCRHFRSLHSRVSCV